MDLTTLTNLTYAVLGVGFLIFVHELGHFLAAKKVGIRVDTFCIGFQPTIFGFKARFFAFKRGETEYALGMVPFGGYVRMAGEELGDEKTGSSDEFASKSISERALVLVAGAIMNLIFGFIFFVVAFAFGVRFEAPVVGTVSPGGPAWNAGILPGDRILEVNGEPKEDWEDLMTTIILAGLDPVQLRIQRGEGEHEQLLDLTVKPTKDARLGMPTIGVGASYAPKIAKVSGSAEASGLQVGDRLLSAQLVPAQGNPVTIPTELPLLTQWITLTSWTAEHPGDQVNLKVDRAGTTHSIDIPIRKVDGPVMAGAGSVVRRVRFVREGSAAAALFEVGDEIVRINGNPVFQLSAPEILDIAPTNQTLHIEFLTGKSAQVERDELLRWWDTDVHTVPGSSEVTSVTAGSPAAKLGLEVGDHLLRVNDRAFAPGSSLAPREGTPPTVEWWDGNTVRSGSVTGVSEDAPFGATFAVALVPLPDSAAADSGMQAGDVLVQANGKTVKGWADFAAAVAPRGFLMFKSAPKNVELQVRRQSDGSLATLTLTPRARSLGEAGFALSSNNFIKEASFGEACVLGSERAVSWMARIFLTLRALATRQVDAKNLAGPIGILHISSRVVEYGFGKFLFMIGLISINLGIFNLLPFPILDGGHLVFLAIEKIKGSPVSERIQGYALTVAFVMLISLALFVTFHDLRRLFA